MNSRIRVSLYATMIVLIALGSAFFVVPARADDGAPPPPAAPSATSTSNTTPVHSQVPSGADVAVVNSAGHKVSLASQQAADITASSDPIWCPTGVAPVPGLGGCTSTQAMFNGGLLPLIVNKAVNGTIWIVSGPEADVSPVTLDGSLGTTSNFALTVNGGWDGSPTGTLNPLAPSTFNVPLTINWNAAVTLNDIKITGAAGTGLTVTTPGNIVLNNLDSDSNTGRGASLNNSSGSGAVVVNSSTFINNHGGDGLFVKSNRAIVLKNITAVNNHNNGVYLDNCNGDPAPVTLCTTPTAQPVIISGVNNFNFNSIAGLWVYSGGAITVGNITAVYNLGDDGVYLDNCRYDGAGSGLCRIPGAFAVTVKGTNFFSNNGFDGLEIWASGPINAGNLTSNNNGSHLDSGTPANTAYFGMGAMLNNFGALLGKPITLTGTNSFTGNAATGLWLDSFGAVKVSNLTANLNGNNPACFPLDICDGLHLPIWDASGFTLTGFGNFNGNGDDGIDATVFGSISLTNLTADGNGGWGVNVDNCNFDVSVCDAHGNVVITGTNVFTNNAFSGLVVNSAGVVSLTNVTASYNGLAGADPADGDGVSIANCPFNTGSQMCNVAIPRSVVLGGVNTFNGNFAAGLRVNSLGPITARQVTANGNGTDGARLDNQFGFKNYNITLTGFNVFNLNSGIGLEAYSNGNIVLSNIAANNNTGGMAGAGVHAGGAYLDNKSTILTPTAVILTGINTFNNNGSSISHFGSGLYILSDGAITISNLTANNNQDYGAFLDDRTRASLPRNITLTGVNTFVKNRLDGLHFSTLGSAIMSQVSSDFNGADGIYGTAVGKIILTCGSMYFNGGRGNDLFVFSPSTITLRGVFSGLNGAGDLFSAPPVVTYACPIP